VGKREVAGMAKNVPEAKSPCDVTRQSLTELVIV
jgi:hypothetical protein